MSSGTICDKRISTSIRNFWCRASRAGGLFVSRGVHFTSGGSRTIASNLTPIPSGSELSAVDCQATDHQLWGAIRLQPSAPGAKRSCTAILVRSAEETGVLGPTPGIGAQPCNDRGIPLRNAVGLASRRARFRSRSGSVVGGHCPHEVSSFPTQGENQSFHGIQGSSSAFSVCHQGCGALAVAACHLAYEGLAVLHNVSNAADEIPIKARGMQALNDMCRPCGMP